MVLILSSSKWKSRKSLGVRAVTHFSGTTLRTALADWWLLRSTELLLVNFKAKVSGVPWVIIMRYVICGSSGRQWTWDNKVVCGGVSSVAILYDAGLFLNLCSKNKPAGYTWLLLVFCLLTGMLQLFRERFYSFIIPMIFQDFLFLQLKEMSVALFEKFLTLKL